jgi:hypothetical protein
MGLEVTCLEGVMDTTTVFPSEIDSRIFLQDVSLDTKNIMNTYNGYLTAKNYTQAAEYLNKNATSFYGAWVLNLFENRLVALETYALEMENAKFMDYSDNEPTSDEVGSSWIGGD